MSEEGAKVEREGGRKRKHLKNKPEEKEFSAHPAMVYTAALVITLEITDLSSGTVRL